MNLREASFHCGVSEKTLWRGIQRGNFVARKIGGKWYLLMVEIAENVWVPVEMDERTLDGVSTRAVR